MDILLEFVKSIPFGGWVCIALGIFIAIIDDTKVFSTAYNLAIWSIILICGAIVVMTLLYQVMGSLIILVGIGAAFIVRQVSPTARRTLLPIVLGVIGLGIYLVFFTS